ncbi:hypothetical protein PG994_008680 [Apiospora phragmitis]|uniref:Uncharacterized protein n=1 Tax=Apiospora phragmitis TaxID=2905665 RepID=A0ABR1UH56_9PEZI
MQAPATAPWGLSISDADFEKLKADFEPESWDDKWRVSATDPSQSDNISSTLLEPDGQGFLRIACGTDSSGVKIEAITWEQDKNGIRISEDQAKAEVMCMTRRRLGCVFDAFLEDDHSTLFIYLAAQIGAS